MSAHNYLCWADHNLDCAAGWVDDLRHVPFVGYDDEHAAKLAQKARKLADRIEELRVRKAA